MPIRAEIQGSYKTVSAEDQKVAAALSKAVEQLDAAVAEQEKAADRIIGLAEKLYDKQTPQAYMMIADALMEACSFQDITGQRINKVSRLVKYLRDQKMIGLKDMPKPKPKPPEPQGLTQEQIDKLLNG